MAHHVLLVEPDLDTLGALAEQLRQRGLSVLLATNISSALARARSERPQIVFLAASLAEVHGDADPFSIDPELGSIAVIKLVRTHATTSPNQVSYADIDRLVTLALEVQPLSSSPPDLAPGELRGDLQQVSLADLIQLLALNRRTGVLSVSTSKGAGELRIAEGEIVDAVYRRLEGEKAFYRLVSEREGNFNFAPGGPPALVRVTKDTSTLLMEAMRHKDEVDYLRQELSESGEAYVAADQPLADDDSRLLQDVYAVLQVPRTLDELVDEVSVPDLDVLHALSVLLDTGHVRVVDQTSHAAQICSPEQLPVLRAFLGRLGRDGFAGPARVLVASSPSRVHTFGHALLRVTGAIAPANPLPGVPVPHELGMVRLGEGVEFIVIGLPVVDAFAPIWSLTLPGVDVVLSLDAQGSSMLEAICRALEIRLIEAARLVPSFEESDPAQVGLLLRTAIEQAGAS